MGGDGSVVALALINPPTWTTCPAVAMRRAFLLGGAKKTVATAEDILATINAKQKEWQR